MTRYAWLPLIAFGLVAACRDEATSPERALPLDAGPTASIVDEYAGGPVHGAIFTTTPDGGIVNENVRYTQKIEVYLDGGPGNHVKQTAAGLPDGLYVFQITDPPGKILLSEDPSKCRVVRVDEGIIDALVAPADIPGFVPALTNDYTVGNGANATTHPCHVQDAPDGVAGASGRHDTNTDADHGGDEALVVQMMPFFDTPNPGGVYKAWMTPLQEYLAKDGRADRTQLESVPSPVKVQGKQVGYARDYGFSPPRNDVKTDNFKVRENPPFIIIDKYDDVNGNGQLDAGEPAIADWLVKVTEPVDGGTVTNFYATPTAPIKVPFNTTVEVCEEVQDGWVYKFALVGGVYVNATLEGGYRCVDVAIGSTPVTIAIAFGNFELGEKRGLKFHDLNADGDQDAGEPGLAGWTIKLLNAADAVVATQVTGAGGAYTFGDLDAGGYKVCEVQQPAGTPPPTWYQSAPHAGTPLEAGETLVDCDAIDPAYGPAGYGFTVTSGASYEANDFGNYQLVYKSGTKYDDFTGQAIPNWWMHLLNAAGTQILQSVQTNAQGLYTFSGLMPGNTFIVCEELPTPAWVQLSPAAGVNCAALGTGLGKTFGTHGYEFATVSGTDHPGNDFHNERIQGCTPGYWKQSQHFGSWLPTGYTPGTLVSVAFTGAGVAPYAALGGATMLQALGFQGGSTLAQKAEILLRAGVAALLNAAHPAVNYPQSPAAVQTAVNGALASQDETQILNVAKLLDDQNNAYGAPDHCPLGLDPGL